MLKSVFLFPGQGAQAPGMGRDLINADPIIRQALECAEAATGLPIRSYCLDTPSASLRNTQLAQPAIFSLSYAIAMALLQRGATPPCCYAGHSLGHFTSLAVSGAIAFEDCARLVARRGALMAEAGQRCAGGMAIVQNLDAPTTAAVLEHSGLSVWPANYNLDNQIAIAGAAAHLQPAMDLLRAQGGRCQQLNVSGAFHSPLLQEEAARFAAETAGIDIGAPNRPILRNANGAPMRDAAALRDDLIGHMTGPVRWTAIMAAVAAEAPDAVVEVGPGKILKGLMRRYVPTLSVYSANTLQTFDRALMAARPSVMETVE